MVAPTINSYKRLVEGAWVPITVTWAIDTRTVALRALPSNIKATRLETRMVSSDTNPYLFMSVYLVTCLYGIRKGLILTQAATVGNCYCDDKHRRFAKNLDEATQMMKDSSLANELFGEKCVTHFTQTRDWECRQYAKVVTDWEMKLYMEIV
jgi:glutamine synthetase